MSNNLEQKDNNEPNNRIIVYNLNFDTDEIGLRDYFSKYGEVLNVEIPISQNRSRGFGFVTFSSIEEATKANDPTIVHELNDRKVRTSFANKREKERDDEFRVKKLYIGKLPHEINETELKEYFEQFGTVSDAFISSVKFAPLLNGFPQHKGYGFVTFENDEDANKAVKQKSHVLKGANIFVRKAIPQRDEERSSKGERRNKNNNNSRSKSNKGGRSERSNKDTGSSTTKSESSSSNQDNSSTTTTQTGTYSPSTNNNNNTPTEKKTVVVKRKDNDNKSTETSSTTTNNTNTTPTTNNTPSENKTETTSSNKSTSSNKTSSSNKSSSNNNDNKKKSITVNQKNTKPVITIQKSSTVNPWKTQQNTTPSQPLNNEFPSLGKKKTKTTTKTVTTTTVTTTITVDDKDSKDDKENN